MKIVIVGGGTAGWLAALMISKVKPEHDITCIESSKIGIIGAGEGSTGSLTDIIQNETFDFGCVEQDFIKECDATLKLGIKHIGWGPNKDNFCEILLYLSLSSSDKSAPLLTKES